MRPSFSLGIEEEYQTIDPATRDLRSHIQTEMLSEGKMRLQERVKAEMHTSVVEVGTRICRNIDEAREDIYELLREMIKLAREHGITLVVVEHNMHVLMNLAERVTVLNQGRLLASGTPSEMQANAAVIEAYLGDAA